MFKFIKVRNCLTSDKFSKVKLSINLPIYLSPYRPLFGGGLKRGGRRGGRRSRRQVAEKIKFFRTVLSVPFSQISGLQRNPKIRTNGTNSEGGGGVELIYKCRLVLICRTQSTKYSLGLHL